MRRAILQFLVALIRALVAGSGGTAPSPVTAAPNSPPRIRWTQLPGATSGVPVPLRYAIADDQSDAARITVAYSIDGGVTFIPATEDTEVASDGTVGLATSPAGVDHVFAWDAKADLAGQSIPAMLRIGVFDAQQGNQIVSSTVQPDVETIGMPSRPTVFPFRPTDLGSAVPVRFVIGDRDSQPIDMRVEYLDGAANWKPAGPTAASDRMTNLPAPRVETDYRFVWDAAAAFPGLRGTTRLRFTPVKQGLAGVASETPSFPFDTTVSPAGHAFQLPPPVTGMSITVLTATPITGIAGELLPEPILVRITDGQNRPLLGLPVSFTRPVASVAYEFEDDPVAWETTNAAGVAGVRIRAAKGVAGSGEAIVQLPGLPGLRAAVAFQVLPRTIFHNASASAILTHGVLYTITVGVGDPQRQLYFADAFRPIRLRVQGTNASVLHRVLTVAGPTSLSFVPLLTAAGTGSLTLTDVDDPTITVTIPLRVVSPTVNRRTSRTMWVRTPMRFESAAPDRIGYPGLTPQAPFQLRYTDGTRDYHDEALNNFTGCGVTPQPRTLVVSYRSTGGKLDTAPPTAASASTLTAPINRPVFFLPEGDGPWIITASINAPIIDPNPVTINYVSGGQPFCERENTLQANTAFTFLVTTATDVGLFDSAGPVQFAKPGDTVTIRVAGLSPVLMPGAPAKPRLKSVRFDATDPPAYTGYPHAFSQEMTMSLVGNDAVHSTPVTLVRGEPSAVPGPSHALVPGGWLQLTGASLSMSLPSPGRRLKRTVTAGIHSLWETPRGTSVSGGYKNSVLLHSGELVYAATDINFVSRPVPLEFTRTFRSQVRFDGPLGPGWDSEHFEELDVRRARGVSWLDGKGRSIALHDYTAPDGHYIELTRNTIINSDQSAFELKLRHGDVVHFHVDGSVRMRVSPAGDRVRYEYNTAGQLTFVRGAWHTQFAFLYWQRGDPVHTLTIGKLRRITDHVNRTVEFTYYPAASPDGSPGWLMTVERPDPGGESIAGGQKVAAQRGKEIYIYPVSAMDPLAIRILKIVDATGLIRLENGYSPDGRVLSQTVFQRGKYVFQYDVPNRTTSLFDRKGNQTDFVFAADVYPQSAAPRLIRQKRSSALHPGLPDLETTLRYNRHSELVLAATPSQMTRELVYDEQSAYRRSRGNLLSMRVRTSTGEIRTTTMTYDDRWNAISTIIPPKGWEPGENPSAHIVRHVWNAEALLVRFELPRTIHGVIEPVGSRYRLLWIDDNPSVVFTYNSFGLPSEVIDQEGVVTSYSYYPDADPFGARNPLGGSGPANPGLVASFTRDLRRTGDRDVYLPGVQVVPLTMHIAYNLLGDRIFTRDPVGHEHSEDRNGLHQTVLEERAILRPEGIAHRQYWDEFGRLAWIETDEPAGTVIQKQIWEPAGGKLKRSTVFQPAGGGTPVEYTDTFELDKENELAVYRNGEASANPGSPAYSAIETDERGLPSSHKQGAGTSAPLLTKMAPTPAGGVDEVEFPGGRKLKAGENSFGESQQVTYPDNRVEKVGHRYADWSQTGAPVSFGETRTDEWLRPRRLHESLIHPDMISTQTVPAVPEHLSGQAGNWPPKADTSGLKDGPWGPNDCRWTTDTVYSARNLPVRICGDDMGVSWTRYDAHGRPIEWSNSGEDFAPYFHVTSADYQTPRARVVYSEKLHSSSQSAPFSQSFATRVDYDTFGRTTACITGAGEVTNYGYDKQGNANRVFDPVGLPTAEVFNGYLLNAAGNLTKYANDAAGNLEAIEVELTSGGIGGAAAEVNPYNPTAKTLLKFRYDKAGRLAAHFDWANNLSTRRYDDFGRLKSIQHTPSAATGGGPAIQSNEFDAQGHLDKVTDANGTVIQIGYDDARRVRSRKLIPPAGLAGIHELRTEYSSASEISAAESLDANGATVHRLGLKHDSLGQILEENQHGLVVISEHLGDQRERLRYPSGIVVEFRRDSNGRLRRVNSPAGDIRFEYLGPLKPLSWKVGGLVGQVTYDAAGRRETITLTGLTQGTLVFKLGYDRAGRLNHRERRIGPPGEVRDWKYDSAGRLVSEVANPAPGTPGRVRTETIWFDGDSVVRKREVNFSGGGVGIPSVTTEYEREERGRVIRAAGTQIRYDKNGNLIFDGVRDYVYDAFDRLIEVKQGATRVAAYQYDALNRLIGKETGAGTESYIYDGPRIIEIRRGGAADRFVYADGGELVCAEIGGQAYQIILGPEGSVDSLVDAQGRIVESYDFTPMGVSSILDDARTLLSGPPKCPFLHKQRLYEPGANLYYYLLRWYSPSLGVFLTADPAGVDEGANAYVFCHGDPINLEDPSGAITWPDPVEGGKAALGALWSLVGMVKEPVFAIADAGIIATSLVFDFNWKPISGAGKLARQTSFGDYYWQLGKGIVMTPVRAVEALERGDSFAFGEEAMAFYTIVSPRAVGRRIDRGGNAVVRWLGNRGRIGARLRDGVRQMQVWHMQMQAWSRVPISRIPWRVKYRYRSEPPPGIGLDPAARGVHLYEQARIEIYERAFHPDAPGLRLFDFDHTYGGLTPDARQVANRARQQAIGYSPLHTVLHETWHGVQYYSNRAMHDNMARCPAGRIFLEEATGGSRLLDSTPSSAEWGGLFPTALMGAEPFALRAGALPVSTSLLFRLGIASGVSTRNH